jgi:hypothetical protein
MNWVFWRSENVAVLLNIPVLHSAACVAFVVNLKKDVVMRNGISE